MFLLSLIYYIHINTLGCFHNICSYIVKQQRGFVCVLNIEMLKAQIQQASIQRGPKLKLESTRAKLEDLPNGSSSTNHNCNFINKHSLWNKLESRVKR